MSWVEWPPGSRPSLASRLLLAVLGRSARASESVRLWARSPRAFLWFQGLYRAVDRPGSPLEPSLRSLVMLRVSQVNGCASCVDRNATHAARRGATGPKIAALEHHATSPLFDAREKAALAFADAVTRPGAGVGPDVRSALRSTFSPDDIVELTALVAFQDMSSKFNAALDATPDGACSLSGNPTGSGGEDR
ncbi:MAG: hypothetical protein RJA59_1098 [Pseudomonadota bacterium]